MNRLLFQFDDAKLDQFRWTLLDVDVDAPEMTWQYANESDLTEITAKHLEPVVFLIPQQCIYMTKVDLPKNASRQILSAIEYQIEEQLAQDIDSQHLALSKPESDSVSIAVIQRSIMQRCQDLVQQYGLKLAQVLPEFFLCPKPDKNSLAVAQAYQGYLLRYGDFEATKCSVQALPNMLGLLKRHSELQHVDYFASINDDSKNELPDNIELKKQTKASVISTLFESTVIDLLQRGYQITSPWRALVKYWKYPLVLIVAWLVFSSFNGIVQLYQMESQLADVKQRQFEILKPYLALGTNVDSDLKGLLIDLVKGQQAGQGQGEFLTLLLTFGEAKKKHPNVKLTRINFQKQVLAIEIGSSKLDDIEALQLAISKQGIEVKLKNLNMQPGDVSARLVLQGGANGN